MKLRDYQEEISTQASNILKTNKIVMLAMEVRTGKTLTSLATAEKYGAKSILFLTKLKAINSILEDYSMGGFEFDIHVTNYEKLGKIEKGNYDLIICDESHKLGTYPKPNNKVKAIKEKFFDIPKILLSGTATPESYSQFFHQFYIIKDGPFKEYSNFYKWARKYVAIYQQKINGLMINNYSNADYDLIMTDISNLIITYTQKEAGFVANIEEKILYVKMKNKTKNLIEQLQKTKVIESKYGDIIADTPVKEMQKIHQMSSGTVKSEEGNKIIFDTSKAEFIKDYFSGKKIGIFYKFQAEYDALKQIFGDDLTNDLQVFNENKEKNIALQIVSGREGISLKEADYLIFYNIDFSAVSYFQARDRLTTKERKENTIFWIFSEGGIEDKIYKAVKNKKDYTLNIYKKDGRI